MPNISACFAVAAAVVVAAGVAGFSLPALAAAPRYAVTGSIAAGDGGWDYAQVDPQTGQLFVARASNVTSVDLGAHDTARTIASVAHGHAVVPVADSKILLLTSGDDDSVRLVDKADGHEIARIAVGTDPDAAIYDPQSRRAVVMNAKTGSVSVIDPATAKVTATIMLKPGLEYPALIGHMLYVNDEDRNELEVADLQTGKAADPIALTGCEGPTGLAYDAQSARLISACANGKAAIVDARSRREVALLDIGRGPDAVILDAQRRLAFIPCGRDGVLDILALDAPGGIAVVGRVTTQAGARTGALDPRDGTLYLPTARFQPATTGRPAAIAGSFHILIVRPQ